MSDHSFYTALVERIVAHGERIFARQNSASVETKANMDLVTEEDIRIERDLAEYILAYMPGTTIYAEELYDTHPLTGGNVWYMDPISATASYVEGSPRYAITIAHQVGDLVKLACIYAPALGFLVCSINQKLIILQEGSFVSEYKHIPEDGYLYLRSKHWRNLDCAENIEGALQSLTTFQKGGSVALAEVACVIENGYRGGVVLAKDIFPHMAAKGIIEAMGGICSVTAQDRAMYGDNTMVIFGRDNHEYKALLNILKCKCLELC